MLLFAGTIPTLVVVSMHDRATEDVFDAAKQVKVVLRSIAAIAKPIFDIAVLQLYEFGLGHDGNCTSLCAIGQPMRIGD